MFKYIKKKYMFFKLKSLELMHKSDDEWTVSFELVNKIVDIVDLSTLDLNWNLSKELKIVTYYKNIGDLTNDVEYLLQSVINKVSADNPYITWEESRKTIGNFFTVNLNYVLVKESLIRLRKLFLTLCKEINLVEDNDPMKSYYFRRVNSILNDMLSLSDWLIYEHKRSK